MLQRHQKKHDNLIIEKRLHECTQRNPNKIITNLTNIVLTQDEISVLELGLKHGILLRPKEPEMIAIVENIWEQIDKHNIIKNDNISKARAQTALKSFTYNCLDLDVKQFISDNKMVKVLRNIKEKCLILKPDKGQGIVLIDKTNYYNSMERLFNDTSKFALLQEDPTLRNLSTVQSYLNTLYKRNEITLEDKNLMRPKFAHIGRAHGLPKIHKDYQDIPPFRPIVDTTNTPHYGVAKYLSKLLNPLTMNDYSVKDSFEAAKRIQGISPQLFNQGYKFISFDVSSLFTNVPLKRTVNIILKRIYVDKVIPTTLQKRTMKKLILDACTKTAFSFNNKFYKQIDGVSMGSPLGPVLANIIMTELENTIVKELIDKSMIKFYIRYVDDTLLLVKEKDISRIHKRLNSFDKNIKFTIDDFPDGNVHFLDIKIDKNNTDIYYKDTNTGQYTNFHSQTPWRLKTAWIKALFHRANKICSNKHAFQQQLQHIKTLMSWNAYPKSVRNSIINRLKSNLSNNKINNGNNNPDDRKTIWLNIPYLGNKGENLTNSLIRKLKRCFKENVKFNTVYKTNKLAMFCNTKDNISIEQKANVIYKIKCPGCFNEYIGKTDRNFITRLDEHGSKTDQPMYQHLINCTAFDDQLKLFALPDVSSENTIVNKEDHLYNAVINNAKIIDRNDKWGQLQFLEAYYIKTQAPEINVGLKASKELQLFK